MVVRLRGSNSWSALLRATTFISVASVALLALLGIHGCSAEKAAPARAPQATPVNVATAVLKSVPLQIEAVGNVEAYTTITVIPQVGGELKEVAFQEGANVRKGDKLFVIDPRPFESQVAQAEANLLRDRAQLEALEANLARDIAQQEYAKIQSTRYDTLVAKGLAAKDSSEQMNTQVSALVEAVRADRAEIESLKATTAANQTALDRAKLQLEYCTIRSPIDGRTGRLNVQLGNVIRANDPAMVTINQLSPSYVTFSVAEASLPTLRRYMGAGRVHVTAHPEGDDTVAETGSLTFIENQVDTGTGTIQLKATFANTHAALWPGQFVRVVIRLDAPSESVIVPTTAVQTGPDGQFVFVVKSDMTLDVRPVTTGRTLDRDMVIEKGLSDGEIVVTEGQLRLNPKTRVQIKESTAAEKGTSPS